MSAFQIAVEIYAPLLWLLAHMFLLPFIWIGELAFWCDQKIERWGTRYL